jgi:hypothetical protein
LVSLRGFGIWVLSRRERVFYKKIILSYPDREKIANHTTIEYPLPP